MRARGRHGRAAAAALLCWLLLAGCGAAAAPAAPAAPGAAPEWYSARLTDVRTGEAYTVGGFAGKVVLIEGIAQWCPNCLFQQGEVRKARQLLGAPEDLVVISLDVDLHEDEASLRKYAEEFGFDWRLSVAPREVLRALGNLYSAEYLNPPLDPMLLIDREGRAHQLPYGEKDAAALQQAIAPYLAAR
jgi:hypothetical protein